MLKVTAFLNVSDSSGNSPKYSGCLTQFEVETEKGGKPHQRYRVIHSVINLQATNFEITCPHRG